MVNKVTGHGWAGIATGRGGFRLRMGRLHRARWGHSLERWIDDELGERRARCVDAHVEGCEDCAGEVAALLKMKASIRRVRGGAAVPDAVVRLHTEADRLSSQ